MNCWFRQACFWLLVLPRLAGGRHAAFVQTVAPLALQSDGQTGRKLQQQSPDIGAPAPAVEQTSLSRLYSPELDLPSQRQALLDLFALTNGPNWTIPAISAPSLLPNSPTGAPSPDAGVKAAQVTFLTEQLTKFPWGTDGVSYCLWQAPQPCLLLI